MNNLMSINWTVYKHVSTGICEIRSVNLVSVYRVLGLRTMSLTVNEKHKLEREKDQKSL